MKIRVTSAALSRLAENDAVNKALDAVNGRADRFTISNYSMVCRVADQAEARLKVLPKADRVGASVVYTPAGPEANAYNYCAVSTQIVLARTSGGWWLTDVIRVDVYPRQAECLRVHVTGEQADAIRDRAVADLVVTA